MGSIMMPASPLVYEEDRSITVNPEEAEIVREIFDFRKKAGANA